MFERDAVHHNPELGESFGWALTQLSPKATEIQNVCHLPRKCANVELSSLSRCLDGPHRWSDPLMMSTKHKRERLFGDGITIGSTG